MKNIKVIIYFYTTLMLFNVSCRNNSTAGSYIEDSTKNANTDTKAIIFQNSNLVVKSQNNDVPDVYTKFKPYIQFNDFLVEEIYGGKKAELQLDKQSGFWDFRTRIRNGYEDTVKFAGKYCFVSWGCGSPCQMAVIIDATTGKIYAVPQATQGYNYRTDSRMLIVNPPNEEIEIEFENGDTSPALWLNCDYCQPEIYIWNEDLKVFEERKPLVI